MKFLRLIPLLALCGCQIGDFNKPPYGSVVVARSRFYGMDASIPVGGGVTMGIKLGAGSLTWTVVPVSTNKIYTATVSDTMRLGQSVNPFDLSITEDLHTGFEGQPPPARHPQLFSKP